MSTPEETLLLLCSDAFDAPSGISDVLLAVNAHEAITAHNAKNSSPVVISIQMRSRYSCTVLAFADMILPVTSGPSIFETPLLHRDHYAVLVFRYSHVISLIKSILCTISISISISTATSTLSIIIILMHSSSISAH